jgi:hypothetical protein
VTGGVAVLNTTYRLAVNALLVALEKHREESADVLPEDLRTAISAVRVAGLFAQEDVPPTSETLISQHLIDSLLRYTHLRIRPGDFLLSILKNDLAAAVGHGDPEGQRALCALVVFVRENVPAIARGSSERVDNWLARIQSKGEIE